MFGWFDTVFRYAGQASDDLMLLKSFAPQPAEVQPRDRVAAGAANDPAGPDRVTAGRP